MKDSISNDPCKKCGTTRIFKEYETGFFEDVKVCPKCSPSMVSTASPNELYDNVKNKNIDLGKPLLPISEKQEEDWSMQFPFNTFKGETKVQIIRAVESLLQAEREKVKEIENIISSYQCGKHQKLKKAVQKILFNKPQE